MQPTKEQPNSQHTAQTSAGVNPLTNLPWDGEELITIEELEGTPFCVITKTDVGESFLAWGRNRLTPNYNSIIDPREVLDQNSWQIILYLIGYITEATVKENK